MNVIKKIFNKQTPPDSARTMGRNDTCWCGSGAKYKKCHFDRDQLHFSQLRAASRR